MISRELQISHSVVSGEAKHVETGWCEALFTGAIAGVASLCGMRKNVSMLLKKSMADNQASANRLEDSLARPLT